MPRTGAMTGAKLIGGDSSSGKSGDWQRIGGARTVPCTGAMTGAKLIGGDSSSGKSGDWSDIKWLRAAGYSHITLFKLRVEVQRIVEEKLANHDASSHIVDEATDKEVLQSHDDRMVEEKPAKRKQTPGNTRPLGGGQGAGAKRKLAHLKKDADATAPCDHCGKKHAGECWYKPGGKKRIKAEKKALKTVEES